MIVYIYTFPNGKKYIGQTSTTLEQRAGKTGHRYKGQLVYNAIQKYGYENIQKEIIECSSHNEMNQLEQQLIQKYNTTDRNYGYNCTDGGCSNWQITETTRQKLHDSHVGLHMSDEHKKNTSLHNAHNKAVWCIETKQCFRSFAEAGRQLGNISPSSIGQVCSGKRLSAGGLHFRLATIEEQELMEK